MGATIVKIQKTEGRETLHGTCVESALPLWRDRGWTLVEKKVEPAKTAARGTGRGQSRRGTTGQGKSAATGPNKQSGGTSTPPKED